jgi:glutamine---fructose-6-phosphate transaminase (isomerizing)
MCGIVGYVGSRVALDVLVKGLRRLEYRGYDSAGIALFREGKLEIKKSQGKLENVEKLFDEDRRKYQDSFCGIGHTRWATHGKPTTQNAHPHRVGHVALVHNGIIENYQKIKKDLIARGHKPQSETDSELLGFLIFEEMEKGKSLAEAARLSFLQLEGACGVVVVSEREPDTIVGIRNGSPLVVARDTQGGTVFASDAQPILEYSRDVVFLENGDVAIGKAGSLDIIALKDGAHVTRPSTHLEWSVETMDKQNFPHYMLKEIHEQPDALVDTLNGLVDRSSGEPFRFAEQPAVGLLRNARELILVACGTSFHAAMLGKYWLEQIAKIPVQVELASEFRYREPVVTADTLIVGISQSGETADTMAVIRSMKGRCKTLAITNVRGSTLGREADGVLYTSAGPEIGVAATKTFSVQMMALFLCAGFIASERKSTDKATLQRLFQDLVKLPHLLKEDLNSQGTLVQEVKKASKALLDSKGFFFIGRGLSFPLALEGALKLKEIAYVHAEGYAAGELKHGPIAMMEKQMTVVVLAPRDHWHDKTVSNLEEVKARSARILGIGEAEDESLRSLCDHWVPVSNFSSRQFDAALLPFMVVPVIQLLSYEIAVLRGTDVDKPRNLAKSVTVE